jgi:squalene-associated FAD-dependent desaturase
MAAQRVVVVGGGLAGMAAAVALESRGCQVTLLEARKTLGGRAGSFEDPQTGEILDNCQHVLLGCCTNLLDFYGRSGVADHIRWDDTMHFVDPRGQVYRLAATAGLPAPLHLAASFVRFGALSLGQRFSLSLAMLNLLRLGKSGRMRLSDVTFGQWLKDHHQGDELIDILYELILVSALNEDCRETSAMYAIQVFQEALLDNAGGYRMGTPACPLGKLYEGLPCRDVRLGCRMTGLRFSGSRATGVEMGGESIDADAVLLAVNHHAMQKWIPEELARTDGRFAGLEQLQSVPILGAHLWFDRPVMTLPHAALIGGPLQWLFRKDGEGRVLHGVISAARDWTQRSREESLELFVEQIHRQFPQAKEAKLERGVIVIEKRATFSPRPGVDKLRPTQAPPAGGIAGLFLAGDYTLTGWPATMEGAVRSGYLAAEAICGAKFLVPDLPRQWPSRWFGRK